MTIETWDGQPVPIERWGKDHWSLLAYVETRIVDHGGYLDPRHLRSALSHTHLGTPMTGVYPTRLLGGIKLEGHNTDLDCLADLCDAGLIEGGRATRRDGKGNIKMLTYQYALTELGQELAGKLRAWKGNGGNYALFGGSIHHPRTIESVVAEIITANPRWSYDQVIEYMVMDRDMVGQDTAEGFRARVAAIYGQKEPAFR
jgi:DNA-binding PadR family transcriptional regulator